MPLTGDPRDLSPSRGAPHQAYKRPKTIGPEPNRAPTGRAATSRGELRAGGRPGGNTLRVECRWRLRDDSRSEAGIAGHRAGEGRCAIGRA